MKRHRIAAVLSAVAIIVSGCSDEPTSTPEPPAGSTASATTTMPSIAVTVPPAPAQRNDGRRAVTYDPCTALGDTTIQQLGFDPKTREREDFVADKYTFIGCLFKQKTAEGWTAWTLAIKSSNITVAENRIQYPDLVQDTAVGGREAVFYPFSKTTTDQCALAMQSTDGTIYLQLSVSFARTTGDPCERIQELARILEPALPPT